MTFSSCLTRRRLPSGPLCCPATCQVHTALGHSPPLCVLAVMTKTLSLSEKSMQIRSLWLEVDNVDHESSCLLSIDDVPGAVLHG